jgi:hypothetical protein
MFDLMFACIKHESVVAIANQGLLKKYNGFGNSDKYSFSAQRRTEF